MSTTLVKPCKRGADPSRLPASQQKFVLELLAAGDWNITAACRKAYPNQKHPEVYANRLMKNPRIRAILGKYQQQDADRLELDRLEVLRQLWYALTRRADDFVDDQGIPLTPDKLPDRCQSIVDGYKVKVLRRWTEEEGEANATCELLTIEYHITPHATAREQALRHKGLYAAEEVAITGRVTLDWDSILKAPPPPDEIEAKLLEVEGRSV